MTKGATLRGDSVKLGYFVSNARALYKDDKLSSVQITRYERLPGWVWDVKDAAWESGFAELELFVKHNRRCPGQKELPWIKNQRLAYSKGLLSQTKIERLEAVPGWVWEVQNEKWLHEYNKLLRFVETHDRLPRAKEHIWSTNQRGRYHKGRLGQLEIDLLEAVPGWAWAIQTGQPVGFHDEKNDALWKENYRKTVSFIAANGRVPKSTESSDVYHWTTHQRRNKEVLQPWKVELLGAIPEWTWDALADRWPSSFKKLEAFITDHGRLPTTKELSWVGNQRSLYRQGRLSQERIERFESLPEWTWGRPKR